MPWVTKPVCCTTHHSQNENTTDKKPRLRPDWEPLPPAPLRAQSSRKTGVQLHEDGAPRRLRAVLTGSGEVGAPEILVPGTPRRAPTLHMGQSQDGSLRPTSLRPAGRPRAGVPHPGRSARPPWAGFGWIDAFTVLTGSQGARNGAWYREVFRRRSRVPERGGFAFPSEGRFPLRRVLSRRETGREGLWDTLRARVSGPAQPLVPGVRGLCPPSAGSSPSANTSEPSRSSPRCSFRRI